MSLEALSLEELSSPARSPEVPAAPLSVEAVDLLRRADVLERELVVRLTEQPAGGFYGSDYVRVYAALHALRHSPDLRGRTFCEWGSGSGVVTLLAGSLGFLAFGIEIQEPLVELSRELSSGSPAGAEFACGSFVSDTLEGQLPGPRNATFLDNTGEDGHELLDLDPNEVDVVYCYPWPGEEEFIEGLFDLCATAGAVLLTFHGEDGFRLHRKRDAA